MDVDIQVDLLDADLLFLVAAAFVPGAVAQFRLFHLRQVETFPGAAGRQAAAALPAELKGEDPLAPALAADDQRAKLAIAALIEAGDLLLAEDRLAEQLVSCAR